MARPDRGSLRAELPAILLLFSVLTLIFAYPLSVNPASSVMPLATDTDLTLWIFAWDVHALFSQPWAMFDANIYHPYRHTLAYAENLIGSALLTAPIIWTTNNLVLAMNAAALLSVVLSGVGTYVLARQLGVGRGGAAIAGVIFAFSPPRFLRIGQLHLTAVQWVPFCLAALHSYLDTGRRRALLWACGLFTLQAYASGHGAVLLAVAILLLMIWHVGLGGPILPLQRLRDLGLAGMLMLALTGLMFLPYRAVQKEMGLRRSLSEGYIFAPNVESLLASPSYVDQYITSKLTDRRVMEEAKALLFPGYLTLIFGVAGAWTARKRWPSAAPVAAPTASWLTGVSWLIELAAAAVLVLAVIVTFSGPVRARWGTVVFSAREPLRQWIQVAVLIGIRCALLRRVPFDLAGRLTRTSERLKSLGDRLRGDPAIFYTALTLVSFWLALGPAFGLYEMVYGWPGFSFIRVPSRFTILTLLGLAILAGAAFDRLLPRDRPGARQGTTIVAGVLLLGEFAAFPLITAPRSSAVPPIDQWLASQPAPFVVAEFPAYERHQALYTVHSTAHWQKTIHGTSGIRPALHEELYAMLARFPDERSLKALTTLGVTRVVVHPELYIPGEWAKVEPRFDLFREWLTLDRVEGADRAYSLRRPPVRPR